MRGSRQRRLCRFAFALVSKKAPRVFSARKRKNRARDAERSLGRSTRCSRSDPGRSGRPNRGTSSARAKTRSRGRSNPPFSMSIPAETTRKKPQVRARRAPGTARRDRRARRTRPRAGERDAPLVSRSIRRVPRCSSRSDRAWSARSGHDPMRDIGKCSRVAGIFMGGTARDAPWRRRSGARRARGRGGRGDRRRRWQTS